MNAGKNVEETLTMIIMKLSISIFDLVKFDKLRDENEYLRKFVVFINGYWYIETDDTREIERLLKSNRIKYSIKK